MADAVQTVLASLFRDEDHTIGDIIKLTDDHEVLRFQELVGLGDSEPALPRLWSDAMSALKRGGIPNQTIIPPEYGALIVQRLSGTLTEWGFRDRRLTPPKSLKWKPTQGMPGVAHAKPLFVDPKTGTIAIPIFIGLGSKYGEHLHCGDERAIILQGALKDAQGQYSSTEQYALVAGSMHTPEAIGQSPAIFIGVAQNGVVLSGLPGTEAADLFNQFKITPEERLRLLDGITPDGGGKSPRTQVLRYFLRYLRYRQSLAEWGGEGSYCRS